MREDPRKFNPNVGQTTGRTGRIYHGHATERLCPTHSWYKTVKGGGKSDWCDKCEAHAAPKGVNISTSNTYAGWYEHITTTPIWCDSKKDLYNACIKHGKTARVLMSGGVMKRPKGA